MALLCGIRLRVDTVGQFEETRTSTASPHKRARPRFYDRFLIAVFALLLAAPLPALAASAAEPEAPKPTSPSLLRRVHNGISQSVTQTAEWLDGFFITEQAEQTTNTSHLLLRKDFKLYRGLIFARDLDIDLRLALPELEERLQVVISGDGGLFREEALGKAGRATPDDAETMPEATNLALEYLARLTRRVDFRLEAGLSRNGMWPALFGGARLRQRLFESDPWSARLVARSRWYTDAGWRSRMWLELDRRFNDDLLGRVQVIGDWRQARDGVLCAGGPVLMQKLSGQRALRYELIGKWRSRPEQHLETGYLRVRYRQRLWRKWVFLELVPELSLPRQDDYAPRPGLLLRIDAYFSEAHAR